MIAELFWPKEMKELVKKYRAEGTCNEEAVRYVNKAIILGIIIALLFGGLFFRYGFYIWVTILLIVVLATKVEACRLFRRQMGAYAYGREVDVIVRKVIARSHGSSRSVSITCELKEEARKIVIVGPIRGIVWNKKYFPVEGGGTSIYYDSTEKYPPLPNIKTLKQKCSLTTAIL